MTDEQYSLQKKLGKINSQLSEKICRLDDCEKIKKIKLIFDVVLGCTLHVYRSSSSKSQKMSFYSIDKNNLYDSMYILTNVFR